MGFPKLKNLLASMDEIVLENTLDNKIEAKLKKNVKKSDDNLNSNQPNNLNNNLLNNNDQKANKNQPKIRMQGKNYFSLRGSQPDNKTNNLEYLNNVYTNFPNVESVQRQNLLDYMNENYPFSRTSNISMGNQSDYL